MTSTLCEHIRTFKTLCFIDFHNCDSLSLLCGTNCGWKNHAIYVQRNIGARSPNRCCLQKAIRITYSKCVLAALLIKHAKHTGRTVLSFVSYQAVSYFSTLYKLLKPTGYLMYQQFKIHQLYVLPTVCLCVLYLSENKQQLVPLTA